MKDIIKKFREHKLMSIVILFLLLMEAFSFILLPKIIKDAKNTLNMRSGISSIVPDVLSIRTMNALNGLNKNENLKDYYELIKQNDDKYKEKYEILKQEDIYVLKASKRDNNLKDLLLKSEALYYILLKSEELTRRGFKPDATVINYYLGLSEDNEIKRITSSIKDMNDKALKEYAINFITIEYNNLKVNMHEIENNYRNKYIIILIAISLIMIVLIGINIKLSLKYFNANMGNLLNLIVTGIPLIIACIINSTKLINAIIILLVLIGLIILYKYLIMKNKIPKLNDKLLKVIYYLLKPGVLLLMNIIFIFNITNDIANICYISEYTMILLMSANYYIIYHKY